MERRRGRAWRPSTCAAAGLCLGALSLGSAAAVTLAFRQGDLPRPLTSYGFVVPAIERRMVMACTFSSAKWDGRAPEDAALLRVFLGGHSHPTIHQQPDDRLLGFAREALRELVGIHASPGLVRVDRYVSAMPRYHVGHLERVARVEALVRALPGLHLVGGAYRGVGMPDVIASAEQAAQAMNRS